MARSALVLLAGAALYALAMGPLGVTFDATPLLVGAVVLAAATVGRARRLTGAGLALIGWGVAVLVVRHGALPDEREAAAFLVGAGAGLLAARRLGGAGSGDGSAALVVGGIAFYFAFDAGWLNDWPVWCAALVLWSGWEAVRARRGGPPR